MSIGCLVLIGIIILFIIICFYTFVVKEKYYSTLKNIGKRSFADNEYESDTDSDSDEDDHKYSGHRYRNRTRN